MQILFSGGSPYQTVKRAYVPTRALVAGQALYVSVTADGKVMDKTAADAANLVSAGSVKLFGLAASDIAASAAASVSVDVVVSCRVGIKAFESANGASSATNQMQDDLRFLGLILGGE